MCAALPLLICSAALAQRRAHGRLATRQRTSFKLPGLHAHTLMQMPQPFPKSHLTCLVFLLHRDARELTCTANTRPQTAKANKYFSRQLKMHGAQLNETTLPKDIWAATDTCFGPSRSGDKQQHRLVLPSLCCSTRGNGLPLGEPATRVLDVKFQKLMADSADPFLIIT